MRFGDLLLYALSEALEGFGVCSNSQLLASPNRILARRNLIYFLNRLLLRERAHGIRAIPLKVRVTAHGVIPF